MHPDFVYQLIVTVLSVGAVYGGIRADLRNHRESIARLHQRIDEHIEGHK